MSSCSGNVNINRNATLKDDVRSRILDAGLSLLNEGGLQALSMRAVARIAGVSHQAPYHYFPDREAILAELVKGGFETLFAYETAALEAESDVVARAAEMGCAYVRFALDHPALFQLMFRREMVDLDNFQDAHDTAQATFELPLSVIAAAHDKEPEDSINETIACWSMAHGLATLMLEGKMPELLGETREDQDARVRDVMSLYAKRVITAD